MKKTAIIILTKNPELGRVKKRLAQSLGDEKALEIYHQMLEHVKQITRSLSTDKYLFYDKAIDTSDTWPNDVYTKELQSGTDMAARIQNAVKKISGKGYEQIVVIGSDCLELDERIIRLAFRQLDHFEYVLGPTKEGGFYLLGMHGFNPQLFEVQGLGTNLSAAEVLKTIHHLQKECFMLSELSDIATVDDLNEDLKQLIK